MVVSKNRIVCDTGALISLEKISKGYDFFRKLYKRPIIPPAVLEDLMVNYASPILYFNEFRINNLIDVKSPSFILPGSSSLHKGEMEAISLAKEFKKGQGDCCRTHSSKWYVNEK